MARKKSTKKTSEKDQTTKKEQTMPAIQLLTIDTKNNCYVINPDGMNNLQQNVSTSFTLEKGIFDIKITGGRYSYAQSKTDGEPSVILWIYGVDNSTFINKNTGVETGALWTTLNGYDDTLQLELRQRAVLCALFFDVNNSDNSGSIDLLIYSNKPYFTPATLKVDSKQNCYVLDEKYLAELKHSGTNSFDLEAGNYRLKIRESNASYWSSDKKFQVEPWALLHIKGGKFTPKLTAVESEESWCSLNGLQDELILQVKEKTTIAGLFFDTYKEDNEGQIVIEIETLDQAQFIQFITESGYIFNPEGQVVNISGTTTKTTKTTTTITGSRTQEEVGVGVGVGVGVAGGSTSWSGGSNFTFQFDQAQMEEMWKQMSAKIQTSLTLIDEQNEKSQADNWEILEKLILKGYQTQAKQLSMQVARLEFMIKTLTQQMEASFNQTFRGWSGHFDLRLNELINTQITSIVAKQVNLKLSEQTQNIKNLVLQQIQTNIDHKIDERVESVVNLKITNQSQDIKNQVIHQIQADIERRIQDIVNLKVENTSQEINDHVVNLIQTDIDERINNIVNLRIGDKIQEISTLVIQQLKAEIDHRIDAVVNLKIADQSLNIKNLVIQQLQADIDKRITDVISLKLSDQTPEISALVIQQLKAEIDKRINAVIELKLADYSQHVKNLVIQQIQVDIEKQITAIVNKSSESNISLVVNNVMGDIDNRINVNFDNKILNFRNDVVSIVQNEINENFTESLTTNILSHITNQQFYLDIQSIKTEVENFYARLGQFETQLYLRIKQGDTQLYNWTLEQLTALQGCLTDRQSLVALFESFSAKLKDELDNAPCVQPSRFTQWVTTENYLQIETREVPELSQG